MMTSDAAVHVRRREVGAGPEPSRSIAIVWRSAQRLPPASPDEPASLRFTGVVGSFSSYALVTVDSPYCDPNGDGQVDRLDVNAIFAARGTPASGPDDPADADDNGTISVLDSAVCADRCRYANCALNPPAPCGLLGIEALAVLAALARRRRRGRS